ncbi:annexin A2 [Thalassophryne amazonica]|uniref:annexin A2 n=1 Tax=Thalassophryne amazonica TaxID=390379 RepID=UPI001471AAC4|nr:annexin A2 [Thalassophryne amazonica]XP_034016773.1 annexin A2 [Thalassophryne amazonica]
MDHEYFRSYEMCWGTLGTVRPFSNFHPVNDVEQIQTALNKKDTLTLLRILTNRSNAQRQAIAITYQTSTQKNLVASMKKVLSGDLESLLVELLMPPVQYEAYRLQQAMEGLGTDEETLLEILCTRSGNQLREIAAVYKECYKKDLEKELKAETSGDFAKLVVALLNKENVTGTVQRDLESLSASINTKKADTEPWIDILTSRNSAHLNKVLLELELQSGQEVDQTVQKRFTGDIQLGLSILVQCIENQDRYLAKRLATMKAEIVRRIMVSHCEKDLLCIRAAFIKLTGTSLYTTLQKRFKGDYLQALLGLCRSED